MASRAALKNFRGEHRPTRSPRREAAHKESGASWRELSGPKLTRHRSSRARQVSINHKQIINIFQGRPVEKTYLAPSDSWKIPFQADQGTDPICTSPVKQGAYSCMNPIISTVHTLSVPWALWSQCSLCCFITFRGREFSSSSLNSQVLNLPDGFFSKTHQLRCWGKKRACFVKLPNSSFSCDVIRTDMLVSLSQPTLRAQKPRTWPSLDN